VRYSIFESAENAVSAFELKVEAFGRAIDDIQTGLAATEPQASGSDIPFVAIMKNQHSAEHVPEPYLQSQPSIDAKRGAAAPRMSPGLFGRMLDWLFRLLGFNPKA
jgi:hypothetical protein